ncbi:signal peptidase I [Staphylococcus borealis]|uniref:signal peptidase I n=1 Tax=Staphylococcus borealis TaxID=2742203 RepID=UPI002A81C2DE|nr:signal peptidase I [Staphylococcus borealis]MDY4023134.1 signal peptidase I [Staphylococcus borealis]
MRRIASWVVALLFASLFVIFIQMFIIKGAVVQSNDMSPTLNKGDRVIVNKIKITFNLLDDGDIIMYRQNDQLHFGRLVGKPGESIEIRNGELYRDDRQVDKFYAKNRDINNFAIRDLHDSDGDIIPPNSYFVLNDNGDKRSDSRRYGLIDKDDIVGDVSLKYYPFKEFTYQFNK